MPPETKGRHKTIVVAAPEWHLRAIVRAAVENKRTNVVEASSLEKLCTIARVERIDLVVLDADLPGDDAALAYAQLKRDPGLGSVPVILLTNSPAPEGKAPLDVHHPDRTLHKHFSPFELLNIVYALTGY